MQVFQTSVFRNYFEKLRDPVAKAKIIKRIERLEAGNPGDAKPVGHGISEMRIDYGPGYRIYFKRRGSDLIIILCAGDKTSQQDDIKQAARITDEWETP